MDTLARLEAVEEIRRLKAAYFRTMDTKDWDGFAEVFTRDAVMDMSGEMRDGRTGGAGVTRGNVAIAAFVKGAVDPVETVHHGHMSEIEITSPTTAKGIWSMEDMLRWPDGRELHGYGHYLDVYEKVDGDWRIASSTLTRLRMDFTEAPDT